LLALIFLFFFPHSSYWKYQVLLPSTIFFSHVHSEIFVKDLSSSYSDFLLTAKIFSTVLEETFLIVISSGVF
jgi:hypothetical protein